jgi:hypothetical protein
MGTVRILDMDDEQRSRRAPVTRRRVQAVDPPDRPHPTPHPVARLRTRLASAEWGYEMRE